MQGRYIAFAVQEVTLKTHNSLTWAEKTLMCEGATARNSVLPLSESSALKQHKKKMP